MSLCFAAQVDGFRGLMIPELCVYIATDSGNQGGRIPIVLPVIYGFGT